MPNETARAIEAANQEVGLLVSGEIFGELRGEKGRRTRQPSKRKSFYMAIRERKETAEGKSRVRTIIGSISAVAGYIPEIGKDIVLGGVAYTISEVEQSMLGEEVVSYNITMGAS